MKPAKKLATSWSGFFTVVNALKQVRVAVNAGSSAA
jgi:hypothetical protein